MLHPIKKYLTTPGTGSYRMDSEVKHKSVNCVKLTGLILQIMGRHPPGKKPEIGGTSTDK